MPQQISPFIDAKYGWNYGESGWNSGVDEDILKFSFLFDKNVDAIVSTLPPLVNGKAYFLTTDKRFYFAVAGNYYSSPTPLNFIFTVKATGQVYLFNGTTAVEVPSIVSVDLRLDAIEVTLTSLGSAAFKDVSFFATAGDIENIETESEAYTDQLRTDLSSKTDNLKGAYLLGYRGRTVANRLNDVIILSDCGPLTNPTTTTATILAAQNRAVAEKKELWIIGGQGSGDNGRYEWNGAANLAASNLTIRGIGPVELHNVSSGPALSLDRGALGSGHYFNFQMLGDILISGNSSSTDGVFIRALQHSNVELKVKDVPGAAFRINYGVCTRYKLTCSVNEQAFAITPQFGIIVDGRSAGEFTSACHFDNPIIEGVSGTGIDLVNCQSSRFDGGTSESNGGVGLITRAGSRYNKFNGIDLEQNGSNDIQVIGTSDIFENIVCRSTATTNNIEIISGAYGNHFIGGDLRCANVQSGSINTTFENIRVSDNASLGIKGVINSRKLINCVRYNTSGVVTSRYADILGSSGTFIPALVGATTAGTNSYSTQTGFYNVIGNRCFFEISLTLSAKDATMAGGVLISGLPFQSATETGRFAGGAIGLHGGFVTPSTNYETLAWRISPGQSALTLFASGLDVSLATLQPSAVSNTASLTISGSFPIADQL